MNTTVNNVEDNENLRTQKNLFLVDVMLIKLGRWLRILGYDCKIPDPLNKNEIDDEELVYIAIKEKRVLLTMDRELAANSSDNLKVILIPSTISNVKDQLLFLFKNGIIDENKLEISKFENKIKCSKCGGELEVINVDNIEEFLSEEESNRIKSKYDEVWRCRNCNHIYWKGGHWKNIISVIEDLKEKLHRKE